ncbi:MAG: NADH dehydrogenase (quinone) subunit D [Acidobacteria bacterium]|nr:MAG: NADH dehydrogenase (quinone) subunit D [Acidobacteriota bacterium]
MSEVLTEVKKSPLDSEIVLNMGPQHPSTHGVLRVLLKLDGERIVHAECEIGYLHTGMEKLAEYKKYNHVITITDRMDYLNSTGNNLGFVLAVEKMLQLDIPPRAQVIRVMLTELQRIASHSVWIATHGLEIGAMTLFFYGFRVREAVLQLIEAVCGGRMMPSYFRVGGLARDIPDGWTQRVRDFCDDFETQALVEFNTLLTENPIFRKRTEGIGIISAEDAIQWGMSGPCLRGSGVAHDIRRAHPYSGYETYDFDIPTRPEGDVWARYLVRVEEMRQSLRIVRQAVDKLPSGPVKADAPRVVLPDRHKMKTQMDALIYHFLIVSDGFPVPAGEVYQPIESARGELGFYIVSDGGPKPYRMHVRTPSFANLQALPKLVEGHLIADVVAIIGSIDIVLGDIDR